MSAITRAVITLVTVATGVVLFSSTASADIKSDCSEARAFLRSNAGRRACSSRHHSARSLFCSSPGSQRLLLTMARSCKARSAAAPSSPTAPDAPSGGTTPDANKGPDKDPGVVKVVDDIPVCKAYFSRVAACPPNKGPVSRQEEAAIGKKKLQEKLDKPRSSSTIMIVGGACQNLDKLLTDSKKCP
jgi:hypothetical protein